jgi:hypothetical protein
MPGGDILVASSTEGAIEGLTLLHTTQFASYELQRETAPVASSVLIQPTLDNVVHSIPKRSPSLVPTVIMV